MTDLTPPQQQESEEEIGHKIHRGNTVDYVYDKCRVYGDQVGWLADKCARIKAIADEDWQGSSAQNEVTRRNEEYESLRSQLTAANAERDEILRGAEVVRELLAADHRNKISALEAERNELKAELNKERVSKCQWISKEAIDRIAELEAKLEKATTRGGEPQ